MDWGPSYPPGTLISSMMVLRLLLESRERVRGKQLASQLLATTGLTRQGMGDCRGPKEVAPSFRRLTYL